MADVRKNGQEESGGRWQAFSPAFLQFIVDHSRIGVCLLDSSGLILQCNRGFQNLLKHRATAPSPLQEPFSAFLTSSSQVHWRAFVDSSSLQGLLRLTLLASMRTQQECICHVQRLPERGFLVLLEQEQESSKALETISLLNSQLTQQARELHQKNKALEETNRAIEKLMLSDPLTELANRRSLRADLSSSLSLAKRRGLSLSVVLCDLDEFKKVNDTYGHDAGDEVLVVFARLLEECTRQEDRVGRWGGEEFLILLPMTDAKGAVIQAERILQGTRQLTFDRVPEMQTVSIGIAQMLESDTLESLLKRADQALYQAKEQGRDRYCAAP